MFSVEAVCPRTVPRGHQSKYFEFVVPGALRQGRWQPATAGILVHTYSTRMHVKCALHPACLIFYSSRRDQVEFQRLYLQDCWKVATHRALAAASCSPIKANYRANYREFALRHSSHFAQPS
jgi:hypothetical protein